MEEKNIPYGYEPVSPWQFFWLQVLFNIPIIGFISLIIIALGGTNNINKRNFARSYFCVYIIIAIILLFLFLIGGLGTIFNIFKK
jgi:hypothetical protein